MILLMADLLRFANNAPGGCQELHTVLHGFRFESPATGGIPTSDI